MNLRKYFYKPKLLSFVLCMIAAWFSVGYFHLDEHFQILEFLNYKLTGNAGSLPWEHGAQIRPWAQPFAYYLITKISSIFGIESPYVLERIFRLSSVLLFQVAIWRFVDYFKEKFFYQKADQRRLEWFYALFWFFPFFAARISSEGVGASLFFIGLIDVLRGLDLRSTKKILFASFIIGFSVWIRFQLAAAVLGFLAWYLVVYKKRTLKHFSLIALGGVLAIAVNIGIDYWGYGNLVVTPVQYFQKNIFEGVAASFGVHPWWEYFYVAQKKLHPGFGVFFVLSYFLFFWRQKSSVLTLISIAFLGLHVATGHKELRFIFPIAFMLPLFSFYILKEILKRFTISNKTMNIFYRAVAIYFMVFAFGSATKPVYQGIGVLKAYQDLGIEKAYVFSTIPMTKMSHNIFQSYYGEIETIEVLGKHLHQITEDKPFYVSARGGLEATMFKQNRCKEVFPNLNQLYFFFHYARKFERRDFYSIYLCDSRQSIK